MMKTNSTSMLLAALALGGFTLRSSSASGQVPSDTMKGSASATDGGPIEPLTAGKTAEQATPAERQKAVTLFKAGNEAFAVGKWQQALDHFRESYGILVSPNSRMMFARSLARLDRILEAHEQSRLSLEEATEAASKNSKYQATVKSINEDLAELEKRLAIVTISPPPGVDEGELTVNGVPLPSSEWSRPRAMLPAKLELVFVRGSQESKKTFIIKAGTKVDAKLPALRRVAPPKAEVVKPKVEEAAEEDSPPRIDDTIPPNDRGAAVVGLKAGALISLNGLKPNVTGAVQVGYVLPFLRRSFGVIADVGYAQPAKFNTEFDPRVSGGSYGWQLVQQQLSIQPSVYYRATMLPMVGPGKFVPYVGAGPRIFLTRSKTTSMGVEPEFLEQSEQSMEIGAGGQLGIEYLIGPGAIMAEGLFGWAALDQRTTGTAAHMAISGWAGYRFML